MSRARGPIAMLGVLLLVAVSVRAQVDQRLARQFFDEVHALCEKDGGRLWGIDLWGPIVIVDPVTHTSEANQAVPDAKPPATFGFANAAIDWGGTRWSTPRRNNTHPRHRDRLLHVSNHGGLGDARRRSRPRID